jgi:hypothetical protein
LALVRRLPAKYAVGQLESWQQEPNKHKSSRDLFKAVLTVGILDTLMADNAFRKIDIDAFDEDVLQEGELYEADPRNPSQVLGEAKQKAVAVRSLLAK